MSKDEVIRVFVDDTDATPAKRALPELDEALRRVVEVGLGKLRNEVNEALQGVFSLLSNMNLESQHFEVDAVRFTLRIDASGGVSLVSLAKGSLGGQAGLEFTIVRHRPNIGRGGGKIT